MKNLSIITNFGCHFKCPECITKNSGIAVPKTTVNGLEKLNRAFWESGAHILSVSGGGDPLYNYETNIEWYRALFKWARSCKPKFGSNNIVLTRRAELEALRNRKLTNWYSEYGIPIEIHTSYTTDKTTFPFYDCYRAVYHLHSIKELDSIRRTGEEITRAVFVVTSDFTVNDLMDISAYVQNSQEIDELSFREYVDENYTPHSYLSEYLKLGHQKLWYYIEQGDYNLYYAENNVYKCFREFQEVQN